MTPTVPRIRLLAASVIALVAVAGCTSGSAGSAATATDHGHPVTDATDVGTTPAAPSTAPLAAPVGGTVTFDGVTVTNATDLTVKPGVTSTAAGPAPGLLVQDVVVGTGPAATPTSTVGVQYVGVLYQDGTPFDASWDNGGATSFPLTGVVAGFLLGIGGTPGVDAMHVGGRRIMIFPAALGYGAGGQGKIPGAASLVFVVDLTSVS